MIRLVAQRRKFDCGIAALAAALRQDYTDVFVVAAQVASKRLHVGLTTTDLLNVASKFGRPMRRVHYRKVDVEEDSGVLGINWNNPKRHGADGHWVVLYKGVILDPSGPEVWEASVYLETNGGRPATLLVEK